MKKIILFCAFMLIVSTACFVTEVVTPAPVAPTFDENAISTWVVETARAIALSATATNTAVPSDTPTNTDIPTETLTETPTETPTLTSTPTDTSTPSATSTVTLTPSPVVTIIYIQITNTFPPPTKIPPTNVSPPTSVIPTAAIPTSVIPTQIPPPTNTTAPKTCPETNDSFEAQVIQLINAERAKMGLAALSSQSQLGAAARLHSADMACNNYFSHTGLDGSSFSERAARQGYNMNGGAENIAAGYSSPSSVVQGWMNSPGHKANILGDYKEIGVGYAYGTGDYRRYWTAVFGNP